MTALQPALRVAFIMKSRRGAIHSGTLWMISAGQSGPCTKALLSVAKSAIRASAAERRTDEAVL
jgi:hypothetical protein